MAKNNGLPDGYVLKRTMVGWWVDGACGYAVAAYFDTKAEALKEAKRKIREARRTGSWPSWRY